MSTDDKRVDGTPHAIVVGGGAAGFFGAITCAEALGGGGEVLILEQASKVLEKVRISGGGRCNVTHACLDPRPLTAHYPRGQKALLGSFHRWGPADTIEWFESRGVELKVEPDGRMFPVTNDSQTIIDCLQQSARRAGVDVLTGERVVDIIAREEDGGGGGFEVRTKRKRFHTRCVLLATGGTRAKQGAGFAAGFGHRLEPAVPSLFTFHIDDPRIKPLPGVCVNHTRIEVIGHPLTSEGPTLITHWGLSGPGILKLSAWGARTLSQMNYTFAIRIDWLPGIRDVEDAFARFRREMGPKTIGLRSPFEDIPRRLWYELVRAAGISEDTTWSRLSASASRDLGAQLKQAEFKVTGKSLNKEEFVTCGGVYLDEIDLKSMESKRQPGLFFAGEIMDVDGVTGGFNFQNAWTSGHIAGENMAWLA